MSKTWFTEGKLENTQFIKYENIEIVWYYLLFYWFMFLLIIIVLPLLYSAVSRKLTVGLFMIRPMYTRKRRRENRKNNINKVL